MRCAYRKIHDPPWKSIQEFTWNHGHNNLLSESYANLDFMIRRGKWLQSHLVTSYLNQKTFNAMIHIINSATQWYLKVSNNFLRSKISEEQLRKNARIFLSSKFSMGINFRCALWCCVKVRPVAIIFLKSSWKVREKIFFNGAKLIIFILHCRFERFLQLKKLLMALFHVAYFLISSRRIASK